MLFNSLSIWSFGLGIEINKWFKIGRSKVFITVILPKGVRYLRFHNLIKSYRKAMNRNWSNQKANPALKTKAGNKLILQIDKIQ